MARDSQQDFREAVERFYEPLYRFAYSLAKNPHEASDITQQTFLIYARKAGDLRDPSKIKSWLFTTLYREFLRVRRRSATVASYEPELLEAEAPAVTPDVARSLDGQQAIETLDAVDEVYRLPLTLFYVDDLSYKEIADILNIPIGTVMSRLSRGKSQLKAALSQRKRSSV